MIALKRTILIFGIIVSISEIWRALEYSHAFMWSGVRLARAFLILDHKYFPIPGDGVLLASGHGPISFLFFLPATLFTTPSSSLFVASIINLILFFVPVILVIRQSIKVNQVVVSKRLQIGVLIICTLFLINDDALRQICFNLHVDAQTVFLSSISCLLLTASGDRAAPRVLVSQFIAAALLTASIWSKQLEIALVGAQLAYLFIAYNAKEAMRYAGFLIIWGLLLSGIIIAWYGFDRIWFNMFELFSSQPRQQSLVELFRLAKSAIYSHQLLVLTVLLLASIAFVHSIKKTITFPCEYCRHQIWVVFGICAIFHFPIGVLATTKAGGAQNSLHYLYYMFLCLSGLIPIIFSISGTFRKYPATLLYVSIIFFSAKHMEGVIHLFRQTSSYAQQEAFDLLRREPNKYYFPWYPLSHALADKDIYHFEGALVDWRSAKFEPTRDQLLSHVPEQFEYIVYHDDGNHGLILEALEVCVSEEHKRPDMQKWNFYRIIDSGPNCKSKADDLGD